MAKNREPVAVKRSAQARLYDTDAARYVTTQGSPT